MKAAVDPLACQVYGALTDVLLATSPLGDTVVQPDLLVVSDRSRIKAQYYEGPPDWIIEIISAGNSKKERDKKYAYYEEAGVREYWVLHPLEKTILHFVLNEAGVYVGLALRSVDSKHVKCTIFENVSFVGADIFP